MDLANSIVQLQPGMYILRHPKTGLPPISISRAAANPANNGTIQAIYTPGTEGSVLRDGKDCIVMQVLNAPVDLLVTAYLEKAGAAVPTLKIDKIAIEGDGLSQGRALQLPPKGLSVIGHVERKGDLVVSGGGTLGDPKSDLRLEGFQVAWPDKPDGLDISYSARVEGGGAAQAVGSGHFVGTRNAAKRIVEVTFTLTGSKAAQYALTGKAYFSGGYEMPISSGKALSGPSGLEHLTAITLDIADSGGNKAAKGAWDESPRTKIFKRAGNQAGSRSKK